MPDASHILGMNSRNQHYRVLNDLESRSRANSKLSTKKYLSKVGVSVPTLYGVITSQDDLANFSFDKITTSFVIKPSGGSGGKGILIVKKRTGSGNKWVSWDGDLLDEQDLRLHISDILEGQYSTFGTTHHAFIEERIGLHPKLKKYVDKGTPDLRIIVFNSVPVMAMLRLPTKESEGRANLHLGGIGVGIDIATGITLGGVHKRKLIKYLPETKIKLNGFKVPDWDQALEIAVEASKVIGLEYSGVDLLLHPTKGPVVIELNASPGLDIQLANNSGLGFRLDKVQGLQIRNTAHGVRVGKALFAEAFADKVKAERGVQVLNVYEPIRVIDGHGKNKNISAMVDTRGYRSKIDRALAQKLGLLEEENILWKKTFGRNVNEVVGMTFYLKDRKIETNVSVISREGYRTKFLIGRLDMQGFMINPEVQT